MPLPAVNIAIMLPTEYAQLASVPIATSAFMLGRLRRSDFAPSV